MGYSRMLKNIINCGLVLAAGWLLFALAGCHAKPYDYQPTAGEMKEGAGVFSGEDGELTIYDSKKGGAFPKDSDAKPSETAGEKIAQTSEAAAGSQAVAQQPANTPAGARDYQEFQEFQQWQKEKDQFHEYREWKKSAKGSTDFKEYQEYQQWQKSAEGSSDFKEFQQYQQWKKSGRSSADYKEFLEWREFKAYQEWRKSQNE
jgi:hypothetical protein